MEEATTLDRFTGARGEVVLRQRGRGDDAVYELIVNGTFAMDSTETSIERRLAQLAYARAPAGGTILIGGLGLGYTAEEALSLPASRIVVVELEAGLVDWARTGRTPLLARLAAEPRVQLVAGDVVDVLSGSPSGSFDAIALDVDNGPDFLIHADNASVYSPGFLELAHRRLAPGGRLAIWAQGPAPDLMRTLAAIDQSARQHLFEVQRGRRRFSYAICTLDRPRSD